MSSVKILHNPRCSKSRNTLALLEEKGITPEIVLYLQDPLTVSDIEQLKTDLGVGSVRAFMRTNEADYKSLELAKENDEQKLIQAMCDYPKLIERPIVITQGAKGTRARIGRPPENVLDILD